MFENWWDPHDLIKSAARGLGLRLRTTPSPYADPRFVIFRCADVLTADRIISIITGNVDRTLDFTSNPSLNLSIVGGFLTLNLKGATNLKLPLSGTLRTSNIVSQTVAGVNVTLSDVQNDAGLLLLTGTPGATRTITLANVPKLLWCVNNTDADQTIAAVGGGTTYTILKNARALIYCDGATNIALLKGPYVEGTFTPTFTAATTPPTGVTYLTQIGAFTRNGRKVSAQVQLTLTNKGAGGVGSIQLAGFPYAAQNSANGGRGLCAISTTNITLTAGYTWLTAFMASGGTLCTVQENGSAVGTQTVLWGAAANDSLFIMTMQYNAA